MGSGRLPVAALVAVVGVAVGVVVWLAGPSGETPATVQSAAPATSPARQVRSPGRSRARAEAPPAPAPEPPPPSALDRVVPLPDGTAARSREAAGGSLAAAVKKLIARECGHADAFVLCRNVGWGWGVRGIDVVLAEAAAQLESSGDPRRGALLLGLAQADFQLGDHAAAEEHLVQSVLAMQAEWAWDRKGLPRLVFLAGGPNVEPWSEADLASLRTHDARDAMVVSSGAAVADGGTWLVWTPANGNQFFEWAFALAADDTKPEPAMAASIWTHAVLSRHNWQKPRYRLPPAASFRTTDGNAWRPSEHTTDEEWRRAFEERRTAVQDTAWLKQLTDVETRIRAIVVKVPDGDSSLPSRANPVAIWSLSDEFARRFAKTDTPRADALRKLAAFLVEFESVAPAADAK